MIARNRTARLRPVPATAAPAEPHRVAVFTAVDGTLLDARTFDAGTARPALRRLRTQGVPVIPVSVMTLGEIAPLASELGLQQAMVIEAGGAIARWRDGGWEVEACGPPAETLLDVVLHIEERSGADLLLYSALPPAEAARVSGRSGDLLDASRKRSFSEPFLIENGSLSSVREAAAELGFAVREGRRFLHLCRACDEGEAFTRLRDEIHCDLAIAVGGAPLDAEFMLLADIAIIVPGSDGVPDPTLKATVPNAIVAPSPAPAGWAAAVEDTVRNASRKRRSRRAAS